MNAKRWKLYRKLTRATYLLGTVFLLTGMILSMVSQPVLASSNQQDNTPPVEEETQEPQEDQGGEEPIGDEEASPEDQQPSENPSPEETETPGNEVSPDEGNPSEEENSQDGEEPPVEGDPEGEDQQDEQDPENQTTSEPEDEENPEAGEGDQEPAPEDDGEGEELENPEEEGNPEEGDEPEDEGEEEEQVPEPVCEVNEEGEEVCEPADEEGEPELVCEINEEGEEVCEPVEEQEEDAPELVCEINEEGEEVCIPKESNQLFQIAQEEEVWGKSSLSFVGGCSGNGCPTVSAQVCNVGDGDMTGTVSWELYYAVSGNPKNGDVIESGELGPLSTDDCETLSYQPNGTLGNYMWRVEQEAGHPGQGELWSAGCSVGVCQITEPTPTPEPEVEGEIEFTTSDSAICQYDEGWIEATVRVSLPEGVSARLETSWYIVNPPDQKTSPVYATHTVSDGDEVSFDALWPGIRPGDEVVEIHWGARLSLPSGGTNIELDTAGLDYYWYPWVCGQQPTPTPTPFEKLSLSSICGFSSDETLQWKVNNPNSYSVDYTWEVEGSDESGSGTAGPGESLFNTTAGIKTVRIFANDVENASATSEDACKEDIKVIYSCTENGVAFTATNPNDFSIDLNFTLDGVPGSTEVPANGSSTIAVADPGAHTLNYNWTDGSSQRSGAISTPSDVCGGGEDPDPEKLSLSYFCAGNGINWTVTNPNDFPVTFSWSQAGGASGSETVPANGSLTFFKSALGSSTISISYMIDEEEFGTALSNGEDYCQVQKTPTPEPQPTPTPSDPGDPGDPTDPQPTPFAAFSPPTVDVDSRLIANTGADLTAQNSMLNMDFLRKIVTNLGLVFLGMAFVMQGITNRNKPL